MVEQGNPFTTMVSCKWLVVIGILTIAISLVAGIILGVIAVHFSNATSAKVSSTTDAGDIMSASAGAQQMDSNTTVLSSISPTFNPMSSTEKHHERDVTHVSPEAVTEPISSISPTASTPDPTVSHFPRYS
ncbi:uncharacterized protein LOC123470505 [Daphnia magna]|uniref:uncharacterized protein LOC123470505 n=1 Tax=Daphnia magna TaxID=35525 RepID=UPI001E1BBB79|nr:uncharacterized protein LOC123470505 [Daphnia magna]